MHGSLNVKISAKRFSSVRYYVTSFVCLISIRRCGSIAPLIFDLCSRWQLVVRFGPPAFLIALARARVCV